MSHLYCLVSLIIRLKDELGPSVIKDLFINSNFLQDGYCEKLHVVFSVFCCS